MKKLIFFTSLLFNCLSYSQTISNVTFDNNTFCDGETKSFIVSVDNPLTLIYTLQVPSTSNNSNLLINTTGNYPSPDSTVGTTDYFSFQAQNYPSTVGNDLSVLGESFSLSLNDFQGMPISGTNFNVGAFVLYGPLSVNMNLSSLNICYNDLPIDLSQYATPIGGVFNIYGIGIDATNTISLDPNYFLNDLMNDGVSIDYVVTNIAGCSNSVSDFKTGVQPPIVAMNELASTSCGNATATAEALVTSGTLPYNVYWSTGFEENVSSVSQVSNLSSGAYYCTVTDANGCKEVGTIKIGDSDIIVTDIITNETCMGMNDGTIDLTVIPTGGGTLSSVFWSNGITTEDMTGHAGEYSVEMHTTNNCNYYGTYSINRNQLSFTLIDNFPYDCSIGGNAYINIDTASTMGVSTLEWKDNNNTLIATTPDFTPPASGIYTCTITDNLGCSKAWDVTVDAFSDVDAYVIDLNKATCGNNDGSVDVYADNFSGQFTYWQWDNGMTTEDLSNVPAGTYTLEYRGTANPSCSGYLTVEVPNERPYQPQICLLTVDTSLIYNTVIWEKDPNQNIDGFRLYRETTTYGEFELIADIPVSNESAYIDNAASPVDRSWRYYLTSYDACGESFPSFVHKTIHVVSSDDGTGTGTFDVSWDDYEGINYTNVNLWRYTDVNPTWTLVNTFPSGVNHTTDAPNDIIGLDYLVTFDLASTCTSTLKAQDWNSSRSNKTSKTSGFTPGGQTDVGVTEVDQQNGVISIYPNPTNQNIRVYIEKPEIYSRIKVMNAEGQIVSTLSVNNSLTIIELDNLSDGIYFVQLISDNQVITKKIIKQ